MLAAPGTDNVKLQRAIAKLLPPGVQVVSGQTVANELSSAVDNSLSFISTALLIFAAISLFVGGFTIFNTFSITVGQRTRELALLRLVGASRRQVFGSVLGEAALTGLVASAIGLGLGVAAAIGLKALLKAFGIVLPSAPLVFEARTAVVAIAVGVGVTVLSAILPGAARGPDRARRCAARTRRTAAGIADTAPDRRRCDRGRRRRRRRGGAGRALDRAGRHRRARGVRRRWTADSGRGATAVERDRSSARRAARRPGPARARELDA